MNWTFHYLYKNEDKILYLIKSFCLQINIDPESLKPKLPNRKDLRPYPTTCYIEYKGHNGPVISISTDPTGEWIASGMTLFLVSKVCK